MIRRNTWILLVLLIALVAFAVYFTNRKTQLAAAATPTAAVGASAPLFTTGAGAPTDINIKDSAGKGVEINRNASGVWVLQAPTNTQADQAAAEAAAIQVTSLRVLASVQLGLEVVGLDKPSYTMSFKFTDSSSHTLTIGAVTPIQDGYYTSLDGGSVKVVDKQGLDALIQLVTQPPYAATPVPPVTLTPLPTLETPTVEATGTASPAVTDTPAATVPAIPTPTQ